MNNFDVIVLGTSLDGLATAALCSKHGLKTAIIGHKNRLQNDFESIADAIPYKWDAGIGVFAQIIKTLEIKNEIHFTQPEYIDEVHLDEFTITRKFGWMNYQNQLIELFPSDKDNLQTFFSEVYDIGQEWLLLLQTGSIFSVKKMMKYRDTLYSDFVQQYFSNPSLVNLLNADIPRTNVTLPVMAGYISTQVFDCHIIKQNYTDLFSIFTKYLENSNVSIFRDENISEILRNETDNNFILKTKKSTCSSSWLISTFDENNTYKTYFPELNTNKFDIKSYDPICLITAKIKIDKTYNQIIPKLFYSSKSPIETLHSLENGESNNSLKIRIFSNNEYLFIQGEFPPEYDEAQSRKSIIEIAKSKYNISIQSNNQITWFSADDIERHFGYSKGFAHRWAFRKNETSMNPFSHTTEIKNLLTTGHWGTAWFTAAITASRYVKQNLKVL